MKNILLPTDFSNNALNAIFTAIKLHKSAACKFIIIHAYEPDNRNIISPQNSTRAGMVYDALHLDALNKLEVTLGDVNSASNQDKHTFSLKAIQGNLASVISELVPKHDIDLIVLGAKGATSAKQIFLGSNTVRVIKNVRNCPILAIPRDFNFQSLKKIVFPTEYAHFFSKNQLNQLIKMAEEWKSQILVFHVAKEFKLSEKQIMHKELLQERLEDIKHSFHNIEIQTTVADAITEFVKAQLADMICLVHYSHTFMEKLTEEPVVKKVGFKTEVPLLVLPE
ncbi:universal stress protein [Aurantibacter crassamenti]|uniref:universal stress protein n=1 Tax=Aurantibacter crassamenti TaxID=1837375 RepID=UPI001939D704|nr:universal stress protein [Aurantibacter crassamenti]MBM1106579.1 universal stress protein [Aurantibacter crassamenti]